ncbi:hypothetical protein CPAV1605_1061 [seawater metagenome]|uniref:AAA+ ATPase domain-containing protein n=1 Tax=seawater metagenome TaxID=1561972 RepID=A0A5E8CMG1_9ZZZZ
MKKFLKELFIYFTILFIIISKKFTLISSIILFAYLSVIYKNRKIKESVYYKDLKYILATEKKKTKLFIAILGLIVIIAILDWTMQFVYSARIKNISTFSIVLYSFLGVSLFALFNWNSPLIEYWRVNLIDELVTKNFKIKFLNELRDIDLLNVESLQKADIYHIINSAEYHMKTSIKFLHYTFKYAILVMISFMGICFYSPLWGLKMFEIVILINYFIIYPKIIEIQEKKRNLIKEKVEIDKRVSYILDDYRNIVFNKKINKGSLHNLYISKLTEDESKLDKQIDKEWNFTLFKFVVLTRFAYFGTWISAILYLNSLPVITTALAIKAVMGISFSYKISSYTNEVLLNFINYIKSTEDYHIIERIKYPNKQLKRFIYKMKNNVIVKYPDIWLFNQKLEKKYIYITGESGKGKTTLLRSLFYLHPELWNDTLYIEQEAKTIISEILCAEFIMGFEEVRDFNIVKKAMNLANLDKKFQIDTVLSKPSGGELQRLKLGRAIYQMLLDKHKLVLLDEPDTGLDFVTFKRVLNNIFTEFPSTRFIFTSHKANVIEELNIDIQYINII